MGDHWGSTGPATTRATTGALEKILKNKSWGQPQGPQQLRLFYYGCSNYCVLCTAY